MRKLKITGIISASIVAVFYIVYLFVLPAVVDLTFAKDMIKNLAKDSAGVEVNIDKIKLLTGFPLNAGVKISGVNLVCADKTGPAKLNSISARINILPLIFKTINVKDIKIDQLEANTSISKDGKFAIEKCFVFPENAEQENNQQSGFDFKISDKLPAVNITNTDIELTDEVTKNTLALNLDNLSLIDGILNKKIKVNTKGILKLNDKDNIKFDIKADSFLPEFSFEETSEPQTETAYFNFIKEFEKYNLLSHINADLEIRKNKNNKITLNGFANIDGLSFKIDKEQLPESYLHSEFTNKYGKIDSDIFVSKDEHFILNGMIKNSDKLFVDGSFRTDKISFANIQKIVVSVLSALNIENNIETFKTSGYIVSDLNFKTNSKTMEASGDFEIKNGEIISEQLGLYVKDIHSDIGLENNILSITNTSLIVNDALIEAKGTIDEKANANISVGTQKLQIAKLAQAFLTGDLKNTYNVKNGLLDLNLVVKGRLDNVKPEISAKLSNLEIFDKVNKMTISNKDTIAKITTDGKTFNGNVTLNNTGVLMPQMALNLSMPLLKINITPENININNSKITINSSSFNLFGSIKNYLKKPTIDVKLNGNLVANDIKNLLPKDYTSFVNTKGSLPLKLSVSGMGDLNIIAQIFANSSNNINIISIDKLVNKNSILNVDILMKGNNISINDAGIYTVNTNSLSDDIKNNIASGKKLISASGSIQNGKSLKNVKLDIKDTLSLNGFGLSASAFGYIEANGSINNPQLNGKFTISNLSAPDYLIKNQLATISINPSNINIDLLGLNLNGSVLDSKLSMVNNFNMPLIINNITIASDKVDLDKALVVTSKFSAPQGGNPTAASNNDAPLLPVTIKNGQVKVGSFRVSGLDTTNLTSDMILSKDIITMNNLKANAYDGNVTGTVKYNIKTLKADMKLEGDNVSANPLISALIGLKDQIMGTMKFDANITFAGATNDEIIKSLKGNANFEVKDGQMGSLGKFETYLKALNIASSSILDLSINKIIGIVLPYNSGQIALATGKLTFDNGKVNLSPINTSGKEMGLRISGNLDMLNYKANMIILGRLNQEMTQVLGALGDISVEKITGYIPVVGKLAPKLLKMFNTTQSKDDIASIPQLTPKASSKTFKVVINGSLMSATFVKSFQWLTTEDTLSATESNLNQKISIPQTKDELVNEIKTKVENAKKTAAEEIEKQVQQKITDTNKQIKQSIENNKTMQNLKVLGDFIKTRAEKQKTEETNQE